MAPIAWLLALLLTGGIAWAIALGAPLHIVLIPIAGLTWAWLAQRVRRDMDARGVNGEPYGWLVMLGGPIGLLLWHKDRLRSDAAARR